MFFSSTPSVTVKEASRKVLDKDAAFIDVRTPSEFGSGHAKGAKNMPLGSLSASDIKRLAQHSSVYVICQSGGRSSMAAKALIGQKVNAVNVSGGTSAWRAEGLPME